MKKICLRSRAKSRVVHDGRIGVNHLVQQVAEKLSADGAVERTPQLFDRRLSRVRQTWEAIGVELQRLGPLGQE